MTIVEFLESRLDEDEAVAKAATPGPWEWLDDKLTTTAGQWMSCQYRCIWSEPSAVNRGPVGIPGHEHFRVNETVIDSFGDYGYESEIEISDPDAAHIAHFDPARALAEVAAKRGILEAHAGRSPRSSRLDSCRICEDPYTYGPEAWPCDTVRYLASIYKDHPDYNKHIDGGWTI